MLAFAQLAQGGHSVVGLAGVEMIAGCYCCCCCCGSCFETDGEGVAASRVAVSAWQGPLSVAAAAAAALRVAVSVSA